jgi:hypothetical protein
MDNSSPLLSFAARLRRGIDTGDKTLGRAAAHAMLVEPTG